ncbi:MAG: hypothetical protein ACK4HV_00510 [Parachlamydiaceae bacterium]
MRINNSPAIDATFIFLLYFIPILFWCWYFPAPPSLSWISLSAGMIIASIGSIILFLGFSKNYEPSQEIFQPLPENAEPITPPLPAYPDLSKDLETSKNHILSLSNEIDALKKDIEAHKKTKASELEDRNNEVKTLKTEIEAQQKTIHEKEKIIEKQISKLEDLEYEIKTLIEVKSQEEENILLQTSALSLAESLRKKIEEAHFGAHLDQLIKTDVPTFIFLYNLSYRTVVASSGATSELNAEDLTDLLPINSRAWQDAMNLIEKGRSSQIILTNGLEVALTPISQGPYKGLILGVSEF